jgi:hypothetical protein
MVSADTKRNAPIEPAIELETTVDDTIATCDGDARAAIRVLLIAVDHLQAELAARDAEMAKLLLDVSRGYSRGQWEWLLERADVSIAYMPGD